MKNLYFKLKFWWLNSCLLKNKSWFTLVELIIVVTILAILATIAFLSIWSYTEEARKTRRLTDKNNIERAFEIYKVKNWKYPELKEEKLWKKIFWPETHRQVNQELTTLPIDPITKDYYTIKLKNVPNGNGWKMKKVEVFFRKNNLDSNYCEWVSMLDNWVTIIATDCAEAWKTYEFEWEEYYIARNNWDIIDKIFNKNFPADKIVTTRVVDMSSLFQQKSEFNQDISSWDTSNVTNMSLMFDGSKEFNQDISKWNTSNVINMNSMFRWTEKFNQPIWDWSVSKVENMWGMFDGSKEFNQDISKWNTSNVRDMNTMFNGSKKFNQPIWDWDVSKVENMQWMFLNNPAFNQDISKWNTSNVNNMTEMFLWAKFNQDISMWDVSNVTKYHDFSGWGSPLEKRFLPKFIKKK